MLINKSCFRPKSPESLIYVEKEAGWALQESSAHGFKYENEKYTR